MAQHYVEEHSVAEIENPKFHVNILDKQIGNCKRRTSEAVLIHDKKPSLNQRYEGGRSRDADLYLDLDELMSGNRRRNRLRRENEQS